MIEYLYQTGDFNLFMIVSCFFGLISIAALFIIRVFVPLPLRYQENAVIGCISAVVVVIYGVLAGFATVYLINNINFASNAVQHEVSAISNLYRESRVLPSPLREQMKSDVNRYLTEVIEVEWPLMNKGMQVPDKGDSILQDIVDKLNITKVNNAFESQVVGDILVVVRDIYDARQERIQLSYMSLNIEVWIVILLGTTLTLIVSYLFGINFGLHIFVVIAAVLMTSSIIFLLISLDKPFEGQYVVGAEMFEEALTFINKN